MLIQFAFAVSVSADMSELQYSGMSRICQRGEGADHGKHGARAYNGGPGVEPQAGSRGIASGGG